MLDYIKFKPNFLNFWYGVIFEMTKKHFSYKNLFDCDSYFFFMNVF